MNIAGPAVALALIVPSLCSAEARTGAAFRQALDAAGLSSRAELGAAPAPGDAAPVIKIADFTPSNTSYMPEQYFRSRTVITAHVWDGNNGEFLPDTVYDRPGFMARFTDGSLKYQFIFMKVYKGEAFTIVSMVETDHGAPDEQGAFSDRAELQDFLIPAGRNELVKQSSTVTNKGVDQGDGVLRYDHDNGSTSMSTRVVNADRSEDNSVNSTGMTTVLNGNYTLTGVDTTYRHDPIKKEEMFKAFPAKIQAFLKEFSHLHWTAVFQGQILGDCLAKAGGDAGRCSEQQAHYDEAHAARHEYWTNTLQTDELEALRPTQSAPRK